LTFLDLSNNEFKCEWAGAGGVYLSEMPTLHEVCVRTLPFPPEYCRVDTSGSPNVYFTTECTTGLDEAINEYLNIYPNPVNESVTIEANRYEFHTIELYMFSGQLIFSIKMEGPTLQIDLSSLQKGVYFITVRSREYIKTEKILKL
jgi:hypothetical protein